MKAYRSGWLLAIATSIGIHLGVFLWAATAAEQTRLIPPGSGSLVMQLADNAAYEQADEREPEPEPEPKPKPEPEPEPEPESEPTVELPPEDIPAVAAPGSRASVASDAEEPNGGDPEAILTYQQALSLWLQRHKEYPRRLKRRRIEGEVLVGFTIARNGELLAYSVLAGSGHAGLDEAATDMLKRASPMPPIPEATGLSEYHVEVPIRFYIR